MLDIRVLAPTKTESTYIFHCLVRPLRSWFGPFRRASHDAGRGRFRFGFRALDHRIRHHEVWDGFYPLFALTRHGGPIWDRGADGARIHFPYPVPRVVAEVFVDRAASMGFRVEVDAEPSAARIDAATSGDVVAFGGGKDSRLILGLLREQGREPLSLTASPSFATDVPDVLVTRSVNTRLIHRVMPSFMALGERVYYGAALGEVHRVEPWHEHFDIASAHGRRQLTSLLAAVGVRTEVLAPVSALPSNLAQRILAERYPDLYAGQHSTKEAARTEKNLHVALLEIYHGLPYLDRIEPAAFRELLDRFVADQVAHPDDLGERRSREVVRREMRSIIWRRRDHPAMASVRERIPSAWDEAWIDYIHDYADPTLDPGILEIYRRHAPTVADAPADRPVERFPV